MITAKKRSRETRGQQLDNEVPDKEKVVGLSGGMRRCNRSGGLHAMSAHLGSSLGCRTRPFSCTYDGQRLSPPTEYHKLVTRLI